MSAPFRVDVVSIFGDLVDHYTRGSILGRARAAGLLDVRLHDPRDHTTDRHRSVDDAPFGGGAGMVLRPEPLAAVLSDPSLARPVLLTGPGGRRLDAAYAAELAVGGGCTLVCGRYEGIDQRVIDELIDGEVSVGDVVLAGGELAALVVIEAAARFVPGVLGNDASAVEESFVDGLLEHPQYTRPAEWHGREVPAVLRSGDHGRVAEWRLAQRVLRTARSRPDLLAARGGVTAEEWAALERHGLADEAAAAGVEPPV